MTRSDALQILGLPADAPASAVRRAYRAAALLLHPDRPDAPGDATARMAAVNEAYAVLTDPGRADAATGPRGWPGDDRPGRAGFAERWARHRGDRGGGGAALGPDEVILDDDGTLVVTAPAEETFERLLDAAEHLGDVTYVDRSAGLLQIIVRHGHGAWCYLTFSLQGRAAGTEVFASIEALDHLPPPPVGPLLELLAHELRATLW